MEYSVAPKSTNWRNGFICRNYSDAKKAFQFANRLDPSNIQILIDLADLQIQLRDYAGYRASKQKLIQERGGNNAFWLGFMTGAYLEGKLDLCRDIITTFRDTQEKGASYTRQELVFLECYCFQAEKKWKEAVGVLEAGMADILNEDKANEMRAVLYGKMGELEKSKQLFEELLMTNNENYLFYRGLECCALKCWDQFDTYKNMQLPSTSPSLSDDQRAVLCDLYSHLKQVHPRCNAISYIELQFLQGEAFEELLNTMVKKAVRKGIPSFFNSLRGLLQRDSSKFSVLQKLVLAHYQSITTSGCLEKEEEEEEPSVQLWLLLLLAQIEDFDSHYDRALEYVEKAADHTPTCYDLYVLKAKILRHAGELKAAADAMGFGSNLDLGDRHMNTKHVKYLLRDNQIAEADRVVSYWTRKDVPNRIELHSLQANWFEIACADSYFRLGDIPHANKMYHGILEHFDTYVDDQFDFHGYVMRKAVVSAYIDFLHDVDEIYKNKYFRRAAIGAIRCAISLFTNPINEEEYKQKFAQLEYPTIHKKGTEYKDDPDPNGLKLAAEEKPLEKVRGVVETFLKHWKDDQEGLEVIQEWATLAQDTKMVERITSLRQQH